MKPLFAIALFGCVPACAHPATRDAHRAATLRVHCNVPVAAVYVDEVLTGTAAEVEKEGAPIPSGRHRVECRGEGFYSVYREIQAAPGQTATLDVFLHRVPEGESSESP
jgi:hypothetical protein